MMPCRPRMIGCRADCGHRKIVQEYKDERIRQEDAAWEGSNGWRTEYEEFIAENPLITFKQWLTWRKREEDPPVP